MQPVTQGKLASGVGNLETENVKLHACFLQPLADSIHSGNMTSEW